MGPSSLPAVVEFGVFVGFAFLCGRPISRVLRAEIDDPNREHHLDGLRGLLSLSVVVFHFCRLALYQRTGKAENELLEPLQASLGFNAVNVFFLLTVWLFWRRYSTARPELGPFFRSRAFRIGPCYLFTLLTAVAVMFALSGSGALDWGRLASGLGLGLFSVAGVSNGRPWAHMTGQFWTLELEWHFYFALPFLACLFTATAQSVGHGVAWAVVFALLAFIDSRYSNFGFGLLLTHLWTMRPDLPWTKTNAAAWTSAILAGFVLFCNPPYLLAGPCLAVGFYLAVQNPYIRKLLSHPSLVALGTVSYSVYLFHGVWVLGLERATQRLHWTLGQAGDPLRLLLGCALIAVVLAASTLVYSFVEKPMVAFGRRRVA